MKKVPATLLISALVLFAAVAGAEAGRVMQGTEFFSNEQAVPGEVYIPEGLLGKLGKWFPPGGFPLGKPGKPFRKLGKPGFGYGCFSSLHGFKGYGNYNTQLAAAEAAGVSAP